VLIKKKRRLNKSTSYYLNRSRLLNYRTNLISMNFSSSSSFYLCCFFDSLCSQIIIFRIISMIKKRTLIEMNTLAERKRVRSISHSIQRMSSILQSLFDLKLLCVCVLEHAYISLRLVSSCRQKNQKK
jgi:hypothetical protein